MDRLLGLTTFVRVVEAESFSSAADVLGVSKSAVSKQISRLEARLGVRLLNRTTRRLSLTEAGLSFYESCRRVVAEAEAAEQAVARFAAAPRGRLRINAPMSFGFLHLAAAMEAFLEQCPEVTVDMVMNDRRVDVVEEGFDLAVRIGALRDSALYARKLAPARLAVCASPAYLARSGVPATPDELADHNCLIYVNPGLRDEWEFRVAGRTRRIKVVGSFRANNGDALRTAATAGLGVVSLPTFIVAEDLRQGRLQRLLSDHPQPESAIYAIYPHNRHLSLKVRACIDFLVRRFGPEPYWDLPSTGAGVF